MEASERLLKLKQAKLVVRSREDGMIYVYYDNAETKDGSMLTSTYGDGRTFEQACWDYLNKISGKTLVFNATSHTNRFEVIVL